LTPVRRSLAIAAAVVLGALAAAGCTHDQGSATEFCRQVRVAPSLESELSRYFDGRSDADRLAQVRGAYDDLADAAPSAIRDDADEVRDLVHEVIDAARAHPDDRAKAADRVRAAMARHREAIGSSAALTAYAAERCDVRLDPSVATATSTTTTALTSTTGTSTTGTGATPGG
jgi:hypothetical protein